MDKTIDQKKIDVPQEVKFSDFGCSQCLWASCECKEGSMYKVNQVGYSKCSNYTYCD